MHAPVRTFALGRGALACALRSPSLWVLAGMLLLAAPTLAVLGAEGAIAQRDGTPGLWIRDLAWLGSVTVLLATLAWLPRAEGLASLLGGRDAWIGLGALVLAASTAGSGLVHLIPWTAGWTPGLEDARMAAHLAALALLCLALAPGRRAAPVLFLLGAWIIPALVAGGGAAPWRALLDPRSSGASGWWVVAALLVASWSGLRVPRGTPGHAQA